MGDKYRILVVEDDRKTNESTCNYLQEVLGNFVAIDTAYSYFGVKNDLRKGYSWDVYMIDIDLLDKNQGIDPDWPLMTEWDGIRLYGALYKHNPAVRCILYSGNDKILYAFDEFRDVRAPFRLYKKRAEESMIYTAINEELANYAHSLIGEIPLYTRLAALSELREGGIPADIHIGSRVFDWQILLAPIAKQQGHNDIVNALHSLLPLNDRIKLFCRLLRPFDFQWGSEKFGIADPVRWFEGGQPVYRTALERVLHDPDYAGESKDLWDRAYQELVYARSFLLPETFYRLNEQVEKSKQEGKPYEDPHENSQKLKSELFEFKIKKDMLLGDLSAVEWDGDWLLSTREKWERALLNSYTFYADKNALCTGLDKIRESIKENSGQPIHTKLRLEANSQAEDFLLHLFLIDQGQGFIVKDSKGQDRSFSIANAFPQRISPATSSPKLGGHRLPIAVQLLYGYCDWRISTRVLIKGQTWEDGWNVYQGVNLDSDERGEMLSHLDGGSGTVHQLTFCLPKPLRS